MMSMNWHTIIRLVREGMEVIVDRGGIFRACTASAMYYCGIAEELGLLRMEDGQKKRSPSNFSPSLLLEQRSCFAVKSFSKAHLNESLMAAL